jgi:hypothetical protein
LLFAAIFATSDDTIFSPSIADLSRDELMSAFGTKGYWLAGDKNMTVAEILPTVAGAAIVALGVSIIVVIVRAHWMQRFDGDD